MGVYYIMIIIKISKKRISIGRIFHFCRCQIIIWRSEMELFDRAWFGCCHSGRIPSDAYGIPTCNSNDVTHSAEHRAYPSSKSLKTDANLWTKRRECLPFKITRAQIICKHFVIFLCLHQDCGVPIYICKVLRNSGLEYRFADSTKPNYLTINTRLNSCKDLFILRFC